MTQGQFNVIMKRIKNLQLEKGKFTINEKGDLYFQKEGLYPAQVSETRKLPQAFKQALVDGKTLNQAMSGSNLKEYSSYRNKYFDIMGIPRFNVITEDGIYQEIREGKLKISSDGNYLLRKSNNGKWYRWERDTFGDFNTHDVFRIVRAQMRGTATTDEGVGDGNSSSASGGSSAGGSGSNSTQQTTTTPAPAPQTTTQTTTTQDDGQKKGVTKLTPEQIKGMSDNELALATIRGQLGVGKERKDLLGDRWRAVQDEVSLALASSDNMQRLKQRIKDEKSNTAQKVESANKINGDKDTEKVEDVKKDEPSAYDKLKAELGNGAVFTPNQLKELESIKSILGEDKYNELVGLNTQNTNAKRAGDIISAYNSGKNAMSNEDLEFLKQQGLSEEQLNAVKSHNDYLKYSGETNGDMFDRHINERINASFANAAERSSQRELDRNKRKEARKEIRGAEKDQRGDLRAAYKDMRAKQKTDMATLKNEQAARMAQLKETQAEEWKSKAGGVERPTLSFGSENSNQKNEQ